MYRPSNCLILPNQKTDMAQHGACSDRRIQQTRRISATGRARVLETIVSPSAVMEQFGIGAAVNTQKLQDQTEVSRGSALLGTGGAAVTDEQGPSIAEIMAGAPDCVPLNRGGGCNHSYAPPLQTPDPVPGMPARAPNIVPTSAGPMYFRGADSTVPNSYPTENTQTFPIMTGLRTVAPPPTIPTVYGSILPAPGMSGLSPAWGDAWVLPDGGIVEPSTGVLGWLGDNGWLALALLGGGAYLLSRRGKR